MLLPSKISRPQAISQQTDPDEQAALVARTYTLQASTVDRFAWYGWDWIGQNYSPDIDCVVRQINRGELGRYEAGFTTASFK